MVEAVIFDMDGLMVNSEDLWEETERLYFAKKGSAYSSQLDQLLMGRKKEESARIIKDYLGLHDPIERIIEERYQILRELCLDGLELMPGLEELLYSLSRSKVPLGLASSSPLEQIHFVLDRFGLRHHFSALVSGDMVAQGKPAPDIYLLASSELGVDPASCLALEDTVNGVLAAKAAGMLCIAVPDKRQKGLDFSMADAVVESLAELDANTLLSFKSKIS
jgi:HAD superfamily hydrolase (TIGR01509 family)